MNFLSAGLINTEPTALAAGPGGDVIHPAGPPEASAVSSPAQRQTTNDPHCPSPRLGSTLPPSAELGTGNESEVLQLVAEVAKTFGGPGKPKLLASSATKDAFRGQCLVLSALILCLLALPQSLPAQQSGLPPHVVADGPIELSVSISSPAARVAETITFTLQVDAPQQTRITLPRVDETLGPLSVIGTSVLEDLPIDGQPAARRWIQRIELESLETGEMTIPSLEIAYRLPDNRVGDQAAREALLRSEPISIEIVSVLGDQESLTDFRDIKGLEPLPTAIPHESNLFRVIACGVVAVGALLAALWFVARRRRKPPPARWALDEIEAIKSQYDDKSIDIGQVYAQLSNVMRAFLEAQLAIPATAQSSTELIQELPADRCPDAVRQRLAQFMNAADERKFSGGLISAGSNWDDTPFEALRAIIRDTSGHESVQPANLRKAR
jgi:hypothetical protein